MTQSQNTYLHRRPSFFARIRKMSGLISLGEVCSGLFSAGAFLLPFILT